MSIVRYNPWSGLNDLQREINRLFDHNTVDHSRFGSSESALADWAPAVDVKETAESYVIHADIPGVDPKDIVVTLDNNILTLKGHRETVKKEDKDGVKRTERISGSFFRSFSLPDMITSENIKATSNHGVLTLEIPKGAHVQPKRISIE